MLAPPAAVMAVAAASWLRSAVRNVLMLLWKSCSEMPLLELLLPVLLVLVLPLVASALNSVPAALFGLALPFSALMKLVSSFWLIEPLPLVSIAANSCCSACVRPLAPEELLEGVLEAAPQVLLPKRLGQAVVADEIALDMGISQGEGRGAQAHQVRCGLADTLRSTGRGALYNSVQLRHRVASRPAVAAGAAVRCLRVNREVGEPGGLNQRAAGCPSVRDDPTQHVHRVARLDKSLAG